MDKNENIEQGVNNIVDAANNGALDTGGLITSLDGACAEPEQEQEQAQEIQPVTPESTKEARAAAFEATKAYLIARGVDISPRGKGPQYTGALYTPSGYSFVALDDYNAYSATLPPLVDMWRGLFCETDLACLFGCNGQGKTAFALTIFREVAATTNRACFYVDLEMGARKFTERLHRDGIISRLGRNCMLVSPTIINKEGVNLISEICTYFSPAFVVVDNLQYLETQQENAKEALELMQRLQTIAHETGTTILLLAHTTKHNEGKTLTSSDIRGSGVIGNAVDAAFCLCASRQSGNIKYLAITKTRMAESPTQGAPHKVLMLQAVDKDGGFFVEPVLDPFTGEWQTGDDRDHVYLTPEQTESRNRAKQVEELHRADPNLSARKIAEQLGLNNKTVSKIINKLDMEAYQ